MISAFSSRLHAATEPKHLSLEATMSSSTDRLCRKTHCDVVLLSVLIVTIQYGDLKGKSPWMAVSSNAILLGEIGIIVYPLSD